MVVEAIYEVVEYSTFESVDYTSDLYVIDLAAPETAAWRALTTNGLSKAPSWSPDGTRIAYVESLPCSPSATSSRSTWRAVNASVTRQAGLYGRPSWSPDGKRLAFSYEIFDGADIFIINADGSGLLNVTRQPPINWNAAWSPDGKRVAFISARASTPGDFHVDIYVRHRRKQCSAVDVHDRLQLVSRMVARWAADHVRIGGALYVMNADGSSLGRLTNPPSNSSDGAPAWRR